jgi:hypothetical protein
MHSTHICRVFLSVAKSIVHCNISNVSWEESTGTKAMSTHLRTTHCRFETLRLASNNVRTTQSYRRTGFATNEQIVARGTGTSGRIARPAAIFADFQEY